MKFTAFIITEVAALMQLLADESEDRLEVAEGCITLGTCLAGKSTAAMILRMLHVSHVDLEAGATSKSITFPALIRVVANHLLAERAVETVKIIKVVLLDLFFEIRATNQVAGHAGLFNLIVCCSGLLNSEQS